jgi:hypothetical protein
MAKAPSTAKLSTFCAATSTIQWNRGVGLSGSTIDHAMRLAPSYRVVSWRIVVTLQDLQGTCSVGECLPTRLTTGPIACNLFLET